MAQKFIKTRNNNQYNNGYGKYYAQAVYDEKFIETDELASYIQQQASVKKSDIGAVLDELGDAMKHYFELGQKVRIKGLGIFKVGTNPKINGKTLASMHFSSVHGVNVTRLTRHGMDLFASSSLPLQVGDKIMVVGPEDAVDRVANQMGNSLRRLNAPNIATIFVGIFLGLIFGSIPLAIPGMPVPVKLGLAGGPLIIAILIGRYGYKIHLVTYTTTSANMMLREIGLVLFLASVGIKAGAGFFETVIDGDGLLYVLTGFLITIIPILIIGPIARLRYKFNYFTIAGMVAGTYTDPPALAYANSICSKEAPAIGYSTVYPLAMFLRIFTAQIVVLFFCG